MTIYFLQPERGGPIKIGFTTKEVRLRIQELQTGCPEKLVLLGTEDGDEQSEAALHKEFAEFRLNGEWFKPVPQLLKRIFRISSEADRLKAYAESYSNCLWSHCVLDRQVQYYNNRLVDVLFAHAKFVARSSHECWEFLNKRGVASIEWKMCQYFFAICWPIHKPWMELNRHILKSLIESGEISNQLPFQNMKANERPIIQS